MFRRPLALILVWISMPMLLGGCGGGGGSDGNSHAQGNSGQPWPTSSFSGAVSFQGAPLAGVTIIAFNANSNSVFGTTTTDASGNYSFAGLGTACTDNCTQNYEFWAVKDGYAFAPVLASNPTGNRSAYQWSPAPSNWMLANGAAVTRDSHNGIFTTGSGAPNAVFTVFNFDSETAGANGPVDSVAGANFFAFDGSNARVQLAASGQTVSYAPGDDAAVHAGVAWPGTRYVDNQDGTATDQLTGLIWLKDAGCLGRADWASAIASVNALASGSCGLTDGSAAGQWRMPNQWELESLIDESATAPALTAGSPFTNLSGTAYWTSTSYYGGVGGSAAAWAIRLSDGRYINDGIANDKSAALAVWAVKGSGGGTVKLQATGFYVHYVSGDDGSVEAGVPLTFQRMVDHGDGTVTDSVTGLVWLKQADCINGTWAQALAAINALASGQCGLTDGSTTGTWRMPNRKELASLADRAQNNQADFFDYTWMSASPGIGSTSAPFANFVQLQYYWTSTTDASDTTAAWTVFSCDFGIYDTPKATSGYSLAVRDRGT
ncbi:MAG TPA: DUF1566 domain-containing protein [Steroidobacteraceae bacterium]|nr:DUF1566 domain-containing protein [Steroidobacteraceae bacterium]